MQKRSDASLNNLSLQSPFRRRHDVQPQGAPHRLQYSSISAGHPYSCYRGEQHLKQTQASELCEKLGAAGSVRVPLAACRCLIRLLCGVQGR
jgi:hypothetical protein